MVQMPYLTLAGIVICIGIASALVRLPRISHDRASAGTLPGLRSVLREPALAGAVIAQFFYVGAQVGVWSFFIEFVKELSPATPERSGERRGGKGWGRRCRSWGWPYNLKKKSNNMRDKRREERA